MKDKNRKVKWMETGKTYPTCRAVVEDKEFQKAIGGTMCQSYVSKVCTGIYAQAKGQHFEYIYDNAYQTTTHHKANKKMHGNCEEIWCISLNRYFGSMKEAIKKCDISKTSLSKVCNGEIETAHSRTFGELKFCKLRDMPKHATEIELANAEKEMIYTREMQKRKAEEEREKAKAEYSKACAQYSKARENVANAKAKLVALGITEL